MWVMTQTKQRIINSGEIIDIFIDKTGTKIYAETTRDGDFFELGTYENRDTCMKIVEHIFVMGFGMDLPLITMPYGGEIDKWESTLANLVTSQIMRNS